MVTLLTVDGVEEIDYLPSDAEIRTSLDDCALYGILLHGVTWIRLSSGAGWWTIIGGRRVVATLGWCWFTDDGRGYWSPTLASVSSEACAMLGVEVEVDDGD